MNTFKDGHEIQVMLSKHLKGKAPPEWGKAEWKNFYKTFKRTSLTPYQLAAMIWQGYSFTPVYRNGRRREENFVAAWHMAFDFDGEGAALDTLMCPGSLAWTFSSFAYSTPSSTEHHPKSRVVFVFDEPLRSPETTRELYQAIAWRFHGEGSYTDPQCKDPLRLYYGSPNCQVVTNWSVIKNMTVDERPSLVEFFIDDYKKSKPPPVLPPPPPVTNEVTSQFVDYIIGKCLDKIRYAAEGERHTQRRNISRTIGGYVAAGYIEKHAALSLLIEAAESNTTTNGKAGEEVEAGLEYGMREPLSIEYEQADNIANLVNGSMA